METGELTGACSKERDERNARWLGHVVAVGGVLGQRVWLRRCVRGVSKHCSNTQNPIWTDTLKLRLDGWWLREYKRRERKEEWECEKSALSRLTSIYNSLPNLFQRSPRVVIAQCAACHALRDRRRGQCHLKSGQSAGLGHHDAVSQIPPWDQRIGPVLQNTAQRAFGSAR